jgi:membrane protein DedA with SNARE-associated domain
MDFLNHILEIVKQQYASFGYLIVFLGAYFENTIFLGLILPGGSLVLLGAVYAADGTLSLPLVLLLGWLGMALGNSTDYWLGRLGINNLIKKTRFSARLEPQMEKANQFLQERGGLAVFLSHFIGHLRSFVALTAGTVHFSFRRFVAYELAAAFLWNLLYCLLGFFLANSVSNLDGVIGRVGLIMAGIVLAGYLGYKFYQRFTSRSAKIRPAKPARELE